MTDCLARYLTADGRRLKCSGANEHGWINRGDRPATLHSDGETRWPDDDPCAWDAADEDEYFPLRLIGPGSILLPPNTEPGTKQEVMVHLRDHDGFLSLVGVWMHSSASEWVGRIPMDGWTVLRAVPPA